MYAIVEIGGRQHIVEPDKTVKVDKLDAETGDEISLDKVLAISDDEGELQVGTPYLDKASVKARVRSPVTVASASSDSTHAV